MEAAGDVSWRLDENEPRPALAGEGRFCSSSTDISMSDELLLLALLLLLLLFVAFLVGVRVFEFSSRLFLAAASAALFALDDEALDDVVATDDTDDADDAAVVELLLLLALLAENLRPMS